MKETQTGAVGAVRKRQASPTRRSTALLAQPREQGSRDTFAFLTATTPCWALAPSLVHPTSLPSSGFLTSSHWREQVATPLLASRGSDHYSASEGTTPSSKVTQKHHLSKHRSPHPRDSGRGIIPTTKGHLPPLLASSVPSPHGARPAPDAARQGAQHPQPRTPVPARPQPGPWASSTCLGQPPWAHSHQHGRKQRGSTQSLQEQRWENLPEHPAVGQGAWHAGAAGGHCYKYECSRQANTSKVAKIKYIYPSQQSGCGSLARQQASEGERAQQVAQGPVPTSTAQPLPQRRAGTAAAGLVGGHRGSALAPLQAVPAPVGSTGGGETCLVQRAPSTWAGQPPGCACSSPPPSTTAPGTIYGELKSLALRL